MIKVSLENIYDFNLPLDTTKKISKRGESKRILKRLENKYHLKFHFVCRKIFETYELFDNAAYFYIPEKDKEACIENYKIYVSSSATYKFWIIFYKLCKFMKIRNLD